MKYLTTVLLVAALAGGGMGMMSPVMASEHGMRGMQMGQGMGQGMGKGMRHGGGWKSTLTEEQSKQVARLKLGFKKNVYPIKAKMKQTKVEMALLITANKPNQKDIDKKIDEILKLKAGIMRLKIAHKIEVRKVLNEEQRVQFDMKMLKKAFHGKKGHGKMGCHHGRR